MANYDVIITNAKQYHNPQIDSKTRLALSIYAKALAFISTTDYTTATGQKTLVANAMKAFAGIPDAELIKPTHPTEVAIWFKAAEAQGGATQTAAQASVSTKLAAIPYLLNLDRVTLAKTDMLLLGILNSVLT